MKRLLYSCFSECLSVALLLLLFLVCGYLCLSGSAVADILTVTTAGTGSGSVNSTPAGIACMSGSSANCSASFTNMSSITLTATPDWKSLAGVFSAGCSGSGSCLFNINGNTGVTTTFNPNYQARVLGMSIIEYATLTEAYANANDGSTIAAHVYSFDEDLILSRPIFIRLYGGREGIEYLTVAGFTTLQRILEVRQGYLVVDAMIVNALNVQQGTVEIDSLIIR